MAFSKAPVKKGSSYLTELETTNYEPILDEKMPYNIYVHKTTFSDHFHHRIVVEAVSNKEYGKVMLGLGKDETWSHVAPESGVFTGQEKQLQFVGRVTTTLRYLADIAIEILEEIGSYNLVTRNCQNFVNKFLDRIGLGDKKYLTTPQKVEIGAGVVAGVGIFAAVVGVAAVFFGGRNEKK